MLEKTYFSFSRKLNIFYVIDRWLNPYSLSQDVVLNDKKLHVSWTKRANKHIQNIQHPLFVEMQLFFSCVVKKRVLFHENIKKDEFKQESEYNTIPVMDNFYVLFRPVEAASCDPVEFAKNYPERRELTSSSALKMKARELMVDYVDGEWIGEFLI